jgi:hypothetical protein
MFRRLLLSTALLAILAAPVHAMDAEGAETLAPDGCHFWRYDTTLRGTITQMTLPNPSNKKPLTFFALVLDQPLCVEDQETFEPTRPYHDVPAVQILLNKDSSLKSPLRPGQHVKINGSLDVSEDFYAYNVLAFHVYGVLRFTP